MLGWMLGLEGENFEKKTPQIRRSCPACKSDISASTNPGYGTWCHSFFFWINMVTMEKENGGAKSMHGRRHVQPRQRHYFYNLFCGPSGSVRTGLTRVRSEPGHRTHLTSLLSKWRAPTGLDLLISCPSQKSSLETDVTGYLCTIFIDLTGFFGVVFSLGGHAPAEGNRFGGETMDLNFHSLAGRTLLVLVLTVCLADSRIYTYDVVVSYSTVELLSTSALELNTCISVDVASLFTWTVRMAREGLFIVLPTSNTLFLRLV